MEYSVQHYQEVKRNPDFRYEPEFFLPKYLEQERKLLKLNTILLKDCAAFSNGRGFDSGEFRLGGDIHIAKIGDVTQKRDYQQWESISIDHFESLGADYLVHNDILMTLTGDPPDVGKVQLIYEPPKNKLSWNQRVALLRLKKQENISSAEYLFAALSSKYCREHIERWAKGIRQRNVGYPAVLNMAIPILSEIQNHITYTIQDSFLFLKASKQIYNETQTLLLAELGLTDWQPKHQLSFVKNFSDTESAGRIDADYFQPKYDEVVNAIKNYAGGWDTLGNLVTLKKCVEVGSKEYIETGIPFVRVSNLSPYEMTQEKYISEELYAELTEHQPKQGEILFSKDATPGIAYYLREAAKKIIPAGGILRLKTKTDKIGNEYLTLVLNSVLTQEQVNRDVGGSVILHWRPDQVAGTVIPILHQEKQVEIEQKVIKSFNLRTRAKDLLEHAKRAVEIAIEQDEQAAIEWLDSVLQLP